MLDKTLYEGDLLTKLLPVWTLLAELSPWILQVVFGFFWMVFHGLHLFEIFEIDPLIAIPVEMIPIDSVKAVMEKYVTYLTNAKAFAPHVKGWKIAITVLNWISLLKDGTGEWSIFHSFYTTGAPAILPKNPVKEIDGTKEENEDESEDEDSEEGEKVVNKPQRSKMNLPSKRSDKKEGPVKGSEKKETSPDQSNKKEPVLDKKEPVLDKKEPVLDKKETNSEKVETNSEKEGNVPDKKERESEKTSAEQKDISTASKQETTSASNENASVPSSENGSSSTAVDETTQDEPGSITSYVGREEVTENGNDNTSSNTSNPTSDQEPTEKNGSSTDGESPSKSSSDTSSNNGSTEESTEDASKGGDSTSTTIESGSDYESKYGKKGKDGRATGAKGRVRKSAASHLYVSLGAIFAAAIMLL